MHTLLHKNDHFAKTDKRRESSKRRFSLGTALTSAAARLLPFQLTVALGPDGSASGGLLLDDGESVEGAVSEVAFNASSSSSSTSSSSSLAPSSIRFTNTVPSSGYVPPASATLGTVRFLLAGLADGKPSHATVSLTGQPQEAGAKNALLRRLLICIHYSIKTIILPRQTIVGSVEGERAFIL
jgi:hypothetical protein